MLSDSVEQFLQSKLFLGTPVQGKNTQKSKPWYNFLYVADLRDAVKIGITVDISRRNEEINKNDAMIKYMWNMPTNMEVEAFVKVILANFTKKYTNQKYRTEIFYLPITPFILFVRIAILYIFLKKQYIPIGDNQRLLDTLDAYLNRARLQQIKYNGYIYRQQDNSTFKKKMAEATLLVERAVDIFRLMKTRNTTVTFAEANKLYYVKDELEKLRVLVNDTTTNLTNANTMGEFLKQWVEKYTENNQPNQTLQDIIKKQTTKATVSFQVGDMVTVTYPPYKQATGTNKAIGDEKYPEGGSWQGRIIRKIAEKRYKIKWAFGDFKGSETNIPEAFMRHDGDAFRGIDLDYIYTEFDLPHKVNYGEVILQENDVNDTALRIAEAMVENTRLKF